MSNLISPRLPGGFYELLPQDQKVFDVMVSKISQVYSSFGYEHIETSALELTEVIAAKGGEGADKEMYSFTKGTTDLSLHYDLTVPLARYVSQNETQLTFPFKRYQIQKVWRAEKPQKGRYREFYQCDIDVIGKPSVRMDAEVVAVTIKALNSIGLSPVTVRIANRKILQEVLAGIGVTENFSHIVRCIDKLEKVGSKVVSEMLAAQNLTSRQVESILAFATIQGTYAQVVSQLSDYTISEETMNELQKLSLYLTEYGISDQITFDFSIARGLDYYTGFVFETKVVGMEDVGSIASGGRYDDLCGNYSKSSYAGVGFSIGLSRLFSAVSQHFSQAILSGDLRMIVIPLKDEYYQHALGVADNLREKVASVEVLYEAKSMRDQLSYANAKEATHVIIIGDDEVQQNKVTVKDMKTGEQKMLSVEDLMRDFSVL